MTPGLADRVVLITGGSRNIGAAAALKFAEAGAAVVICARGREELDATAEDIRATTGAEVLAVAADLARQDGPDLVVGAALDRYGRVDTFVHNAFYNAMSAGDELFSLEPRHWDLAFRLNVTAAYDIARLVAPGMADRGTGSIVTVLSTACFTVLSPYVAYAASKAGLWQLTRYLAVELAPAVRVNAVCPGTTPADASDRRTDWDALLAKVPLRRLGTAEDSARAIVHLASDAASYTTGQVLFADGGRAALGPAF